MGQVDSRDRAQRNAFTHAGRLSERQRLLLMARLEPDYGKKAELLDRLLTQFPDVEEAYALAERLYNPVVGPVPNLEKLLGITRSGVDTMPASKRVRGAFGFTLLEAGRFAEAAHEFQEYARIAPREAHPHTRLGDAYVLLGEVPKAVESYSRAAAIDRRVASNGLAYALAMDGRFDEALAAGPSLEQITALIVSRIGRYGDADRLIRTGVARAEADNDMLIAAGLHLIGASLAFEQGDYPAMLRAIRATRERLSAVPVGFAQNMAFIADTLAGVADLRLGRVGRAQALADRQAYTLRPSNPVDRLWHGILKGELALARGEPAAATAAFSAGELPRRGVSFHVLGSVLTNNLILRDGLARAAHARGDSAAAIELYRQLLANGAQLKWVSLYEPRYVLQLARLLDSTGDRQAARVEYARFVELWKLADPNLPEVAEARRALGKK
jgi:tetratricopeptide (TPR) repeat protein